MELFTLSEVINHFLVLISDKASEEMDAIYTYIAEVLLSPVAAANQYDRIADAIISLDTIPKRIKLMDSEPERSKKLYSTPGMLDWRDDFMPIKAILTTRVLETRKEKLTKSGEKSSVKTAFQCVEYSF